MKTSTIAQSLALLAASATALPSHITYPPRTGANLPSYPKGTGENLASYPTPPNGYGFGNVGKNCPPTTGAFPFNFTSTYSVVATPDQVVNTLNVATGGLPGTTGFYDFGVNSDLDYICYFIKIVGFRGEYQSPAATATHLHEAALGRSGPPRLSFPNPTGSGHERTSIGCLKGPYLTGLVVNGTDTGVGFKVAQIEANPSGFMADVHSSLAVPGAVRGQLS